MMFSAIVVAVRIPAEIRPLQLTLHFNGKLALLLL